MAYQDSPMNSREVLCTEQKWIFKKLSDLLHFTNKKSYLPNFSGGQVEILIPKY